MKATSHLLIGGTTVATLVALTPLDTGITASGLGSISAFLKLDILGMTLLGSLLADIDSDNSIISKLFKDPEQSVTNYKRRLWVFILAAFTFSSLIAPAILCAGLFGVRYYYFLKNKFKENRHHRALPHSVFGLVGFSAAIYFLQGASGLTLLIPFAVTYALHLFFDCFTMQGIPFFGIGLNSMHVRLPRILCYSNDSYGSSKKEMLITYGYVVIVAFPFIQRVMEVFSKI